ncbi:hypothetical protein H8E52_04760 [bacterium]|nr:hypothetical protein [bacterium]
MKIVILALALLLTFSPAHCEEIILVIDGQNLRLLNNDIYLVCESSIDVVLHIDGATILVTEIQHVEEWYTCMCHYDIVYDFSVGQGQYILQLWRCYAQNNYPTFIWDTEFEILEPGPTIPPAAMQSECGGWGPEGPPTGLSSELSWSAIRSLY